MVTHDNDGVACFGLDLLARAPDWLGPPATRPATVPKTERWQSPTTFVQTLIDMKNSAHVIPGKFGATGHDYRADLGRFIREVYALPASDEQLASIERALRRTSCAARHYWTHKTRKGGGNRAPGAAEKMTAGTRGPSIPPGAGTEIAASAATLAYDVVMNQATTPGTGYVTANARARWSADSGATAHLADQVVDSNAVLCAPLVDLIAINRIGQNPRRLVS